MAISHNGYIIGYEDYSLFTGYHENPLNIYVQKLLVSCQSIWMGVSRNLSYLKHLTVLSSNPVHYFSCIRNTQTSFSMERHSPTLYDFKIAANFSFQNLIFKSINFSKTLQDIRNSMFKFPKLWCKDCVKIGLWGIDQL